MEYTKFYHAVSIQTTSKFYAVIASMAETRFKAILFFIAVPSEIKRQTDAKFHVFKTTLPLFSPRSRIAWASAPVPSSRPWDPPQ